MVTSPFSSKLPLLHDAATSFTAWIVFFGLKATGMIIMAKQFHLTTMVITCKLQSGFSFATFGLLHCMTTFQVMVMKELLMLESGHMLLLDASESFTISFFVVLGFIHLNLLG